MKRRTLSALVQTLLSGALGLFPPGEPAQAHVFAPALLELREVGEQFGEYVVSVRWKQPRVRASGSLLEPVLPAECVPGEPLSVIEGTGLVSTWMLECPRTLVGERIAVEGIAGSGADVVLRVSFEDGRTLTQVLNADQPEFLVPEHQTALSVAVDYARVGIEHILSGWDHLLFVLGLVLLVGWGRMLLWTVTAFTLGHSVTLALAVLGFVRFPPQPIEALIAFSIYLLAIELARRQSHRQTLMDRVPWIVAGGFGLLHGLGFAGALQQVGLPEGEIPLALFAFNVGIEIGQLAFVALVLASWAALRAVSFEWPKWALRVPAYGIGTLAAYWFFERVADTLVGV